MFPALPTGRLTAQPCERGPHRLDHQVPLPRTGGLRALAVYLHGQPAAGHSGLDLVVQSQGCLLYTSDAADE